jgi:hypothetical protein
VNLDSRWCDLSVREYLVIERAWGWGMGLLQLAVIAGGGLLGRKIWLWWRAHRKTHEPPLPPELTDDDLYPKSPCPACGSLISAADATLYREGLYVDAESELGRFMNGGAPGVWVRDLKTRESGHSLPACEVPKCTRSKGHPGYHSTE